MVTDVTAEGPDGLVLQRPVASVAGAGAQGKEDGSASRSQSLRVGDGGTAAEAERETVGRRGPTGTQGQVSSEQPRGRGGTERLVPTRQPLGSPPRAGNLQRRGRREPLLCRHELLGGGGGTVPCPPRGKDPVLQKGTLRSKTALGTRAGWHWAVGCKVWNLKLRKLPGEQERQGTGSGRKGETPGGGFQKAPQAAEEQSPSSETRRASSTWDRGGEAAGHGTERRRPAPSGRSGSEAAVDPDGRVTGRCAEGTPPLWGSAPSKTPFRRGQDK